MLSLTRVLLLSVVLYVLKSEVASYNDQSLVDYDNMNDNEDYSVMNVMNEYDKQADDTTNQETEYDSDFDYDNDEDDNDDWGNWGRHIRHVVRHPIVRRHPVVRHGRHIVRHFRKWDDQDDNVYDNDNDEDEEEGWGRIARIVRGHVRRVVRNPHVRRAITRVARNPIVRRIARHVRRFRKWDDQDENDEDEEWGRWRPIVRIVRRHVPPGVRRVIRRVARNPHVRRVFRRIRRKWDDDEDMMTQDNDNDDDDDDDDELWAHHFNHIHRIVRRLPRPPVRPVIRHPIVRHWDDQDENDEEWGRFRFGNIAKRAINHARRIAQRIRRHLPRRVNRKWEDDQDETILLDTDDDDDDDDDDMMYSN